MMINKDFEITNVDQLRECIAEPAQATYDKIEHHLLPPFIDYIGLSPFVVIATSNKEGEIFTSPKGDAPGFVCVLDGQQLVIPERKGNRLAMGCQNIIETGKISLLFIVPGARETLRVNGTAHLNRDPALLSALAVDGTPALLATVVSVKDAFFHCGKAMVRSGLWHERQLASQAEQLVRTYFSDRRKLSRSDVGRMLDEDYKSGL